MQIIFGREAALQAQEKYTVLELETIPVEGGQSLEAFCVVPVESLVMEMQSLEQTVRLHEKFVQAVKNDDVDTCQALASQLVGKFGGELDTFYQIINNRCRDTGSTAFTVPPPADD
jgi:hypothetical protein